MRTIIRSICGGFLVILFAGFVMTQVFGTSRSNIAQVIQQAGDIATANSYNYAD